MEVTFNYIKNRIREHSKPELLNACYNLLNIKRDEAFPIWYVFILIKWTYKFAGEKYPSKQLTDKKFANIYNSISNFNQSHINEFIKKGKVDRALNIFYSQQFYLQKNVSKEVFATQLKLYKSISGKYNIDNSFKEKTGFSIYDFLYIQQLIWLYININILENKSLKFEGNLSNDFLLASSELTSVEKIKSFLNLLVLNPNNPLESINNFKRALNNEDLQSMETTFLTLYPFYIHLNQIKLIHKAIFNHTVNYYIYDYLKSNDENFTTEFGRRFEKYIELGIREINYKYFNENELSKILPKNSKVVDFYIKECNIFIECKAIEIQPLTSINPTDELLYNSLKGSLLKAYFEQLLTVSKVISPDNENWGIIVTYKELFWSKFTDLFELGMDKFENSKDYQYLKPENVFIIDIYTWDKIIQIVKDNKATLLEILQDAKRNNSKPESTKQLFNMHLDKYDLKTMNLSYLQNEIRELQIRNT
jgi:hypothetical protein